MNKPIAMAIVALGLLVGSAIMVPIIHLANAQYTTPTAPGSVEEQIKLAKEKIQNTQQAGAYGSGTAMLGGSSETPIFIGVLAAIFGGVAAAFFIKSRSGVKKEATV
ncbi:MAG TPA: hypothetical protein VE622_06025 [Nitrososphaeraceae archaeon]|jgi:hypothetical protein|nr:hypothetical protein [Nitrososphaeraceae archaeon]